jgi:hypothetical protein
MNQYYTGRNSLIFLREFSHDNSYRLDDWMIRVRFPAGAENFSLLHHVQTGFGAHSVSIHWIWAALSLGVKRPGREVETHLHLLTRSNNAWSYTSTPQYVFVAWCLFKAQGKLYFYLILYYSIAD